MQDNIETFESVTEATAKCLLDDSEIRSLLSAATTKIANERLKKNLAILLEDCAHSLITDSDLQSLGHFVSVAPLIWPKILLRSSAAGIEEAGCR